MCHNMKMLEKLIIGRRSSGQYFGYDLDPILTYCYGGLRKKLDVEAPSLPEIDVSVSQQKVRLRDTRYIDTSGILKVKNGYRDTLKKYIYESCHWLIGIIENS